MECMSKADEQVFFSIDEYLTYKMSRCFDTYVLLIGLKDDSGFLMDFMGGRGGVEYNLYKEKGPAVFAFVGNDYKLLRNDDAKWIVDLALKLCQQLFDKN